MKQLSIIKISRLEIREYDSINQTNSDYVGGTSA